MRREAMTLTQAFKEEGIELGRRQKEREIASNMLRMQLPLTLISEITGLDLYQLNQLKEISDDVTQE